MVALSEPLCQRYLTPGLEETTFQTIAMRRPTWRSSSSSLVDKKTGRRRGIVWVGIGLATLQQLVGINGVLTVFLINRAGRKPLLLIGSIGIALTPAIVTGCFSIRTRAANGSRQLSKSTGLTALLYFPLQHEAGSQNVGYVRDPSRCQDGPRDARN
jgi:hypothetical protein